MTARDFNGTTDRLDWANVTDATATAHTFGVWVDWDTLPDSPRSNFGVMTFNDAADTGIALHFQINVDSDRVQVVVFGSPLMQRQSNDGAITTGKHLMLYTFDGTSSPTGINIYVDGSEVSYLSATGGGGTLTANGGAWGLMGRSFDDARNCDGRCWWPAWWNRVLSADEIAALAAGYHPSFFASGLQWCPDLSSLKDPYSGLTGTADGTTTQDSVGPQILPCGPMVWTAEPSFVGSPWYYNLQQRLLAG